MSSCPMPRQLAIVIPTDMDPAAAEFVRKFAEAMALQLHQVQLQDDHRDIRLDLAPAEPA